MAKKASELSERMRDIALNERPKPSLEPVPETEDLQVATAAAAPTEPGQGSGTRRSRPKPHATSRYTIDLDQNQRRALKLFALNLDCDASEVVRSLLSMLQESDEIKREVTARVEAARSTAVTQ
jgi:hypothetical protein